MKKSQKKLILSAAPINEEIFEYFRNAPPVLTSDQMAKVLEVTVRRAKKAHEIKTSVDDATNTINKKTEGYKWLKKNAKDAENPTFEEKFLALCNEINLPQGEKVEQLIIEKFKAQDIPFFIKFGRRLKQKAPQLNPLEAFLIDNWINSELEDQGIPPLCTWPDKELVELYNLLLKEEGKLPTLTLEVLIKTRQRLGLVHGRKEF